MGRDIRKALFFGVSLQVLHVPFALAQGAPAGVTEPASSTDASPSDIVVTAQRREQRLQDVPLAVTALTASQLAKQGVNGLGDLGIGRVPGLAVSSTFGSETTMLLNIRGFGPTDPTGGTADLPVGVYIDGVPFARAQGLSLDLVSPERIEVLRGPQGQLFGRNSVAGAIQIVTKRPSGTLSGEISGGLGTFGLFSTKARVDLPEIAGFKVQVSGSYRRRSGYYDNVPNSNLRGVSVWTTNPLASYHFPVSNYDRDLGQLKTYGGRVAVEFETGPVNAFYSFDYSWARDDQSFTSFRKSPRAGTIFKSLIHNYRL